MSDFKIIYRILRVLQAAMDCEEFAPERLSPDMLGTSQTRLEALLLMLREDGYIAGLHVVQYDGMARPKVLLAQSAPRITLKGLEYLEENSLMRKAANALRGVLDVVK